MEFSTKKMICKISAIVIALSSAVAMALPAFADGTLVVGPYYYSGSTFTNFSDDYYGSVSKFSVDPSISLLHPTDSAYNGKYKETGYYVYGTNNSGSYYIIASDYDSGTQKDVSANPTGYNQSDVTRKYYFGNIRKGTSSSYSVKEGYSVDIRKYS